MHKELTGMIMKKNKRSFSDGGKTFSRDQRISEASQEDLDEYIRVSRPSVLVVIISLLVILIAVIGWGFIGTLPVMETVTGAVINSSYYNNESGTSSEFTSQDQVLVYCFLDASRYTGKKVSSVNKEVTLKMRDGETFKGKIISRDALPVDRLTAKSLLFDNEWLTDQLVPDNYSWWIIITPETDLSEYTYSMADVTILIEEVAPIQFLINKQEGS